MWPDFQPDARSLDTGLAPRRNTEGGIQPADKSLINRRLSAPSPALCRHFYQTNRGFDRVIPFTHHIERTIYGKDVMDLTIFGLRSM